MTDVLFNQSGAELRIQDGGAYKSATMLENSIEGIDFHGAKNVTQLQNQYIVLWS